MDPVATPWSPHNPVVDAKVFPGHKQQQGPVQSMSVQLPRGTAWCVWRLTWRRVPERPPSGGAAASSHPCWKHLLSFVHLPSATEVSISRQLGFGYENAT